MLSSSLSSSSLVGIGIVVVVSGVGVVIVIVVVVVVVVVVVAVAVAFACFCNFCNFCNFGFRTCIIPSVALPWVGGCVYVYIHFFQSTCNHMCVYMSNVDICIEICKHIMQF